MLVGYTIRHHLRENDEVVYSKYVNIKKGFVMLGKSVLVFPVIGLLISTPALAHDFWSNGEEVPAWVKAECCGKGDAHHIRAGAVHIRPDGYHVDGIQTVIAIDKTLPSLDGSYWAFWNPRNEPAPPIICFFAPLNGAEAWHRIFKLAGGLALLTIATAVLIKVRK